MKKGDVLLFTVGGTQKFQYIAQIKKPLSKFDEKGNLINREEISKLANRTFKNFNEITKEKTVDPEEFEIFFELENVKKFDYLKTTVLTLAGLLRLQYSNLANPTEEFQKFCYEALQK